MKSVPVGQEKNISIATVIYRLNSFKSICKALALAFSWFTIGAG